MFSIRAIVKTLVPLFILAGYILVFEQFKTIDVKPLGTTNSENGFNAKRAFEDLSYLLLDEGEETAHPVDSKANYGVASRLISTMRALGYQEEIQQQEFCLDHNNASAKCARIKNILFRVNGSTHSAKNNSDDTNKAILLSAHYDSVNVAPGASDAGTAVATLIEIARLMANQQQALNDIVFLFNDGEEAGLLGARAFINSHPYAKEIKWVLNLDAIGSTGRSLMIESDENNGELIESFSKATSKSNPSPLASSFIYFLWENMPSDTDMTVFKEYGLSGLNFINLEGSAHYHTPLDSLANVDLGSLQEHGNHLWALVDILKNKSMIENSFVDKQVYQDVIGYGIIHWNQAIGVITSLVTLFLFLIMLYLFKNDIYRFWNSLISTIVTLVFILGVSIVTVVILKKGIQLVSFQLSGSSEPWFHQFLPMQLFLILGVFLVATVCFEFLKNTICYPILTVLLPLTLSIIAVLSAIFEPKLSGMFIIVSVLSQIVLIPIFITRYRNSFISERISYRVTGIILTSISMLVFAPNIYLLEVMMTFYWTPIIGFFIAITFINGALVAFSGNQDNSLSAKGNRSLINYFKQLEFKSLDKIIIAILFVGCTFFVLVSPIYTPETPNTLNLEYLQLDSKGKSKSSQQQAYILAGSKMEKLNAELISSFNNMHEFKISSIKPWSTRKYINASIESLDIQPISFNILSDTMLSESRKIKIQLDANNVLINDLKLFFPLSSKLKSIDTGSNFINYEDDDLENRKNYGFHCVGMSCANITLDIEVEKQSQFILSLVETRKGLPIELDNIALLKGDDLVEKGKGDRIMIRQGIDFN